MKVQNTNLRIVVRDLARVKADAIVVSTEGSAQLRRTGVKNMIPVKITDAKGKATENSLRTACRQAFERAGKKRVSVLAVAIFETPDMSVIGVAKILAQETLKYLRFGTPRALKEIIFVLKDASGRLAVEKNLIGYVRHIQEDLGKGPYVTTDAIIELSQGIIVIERSNPPYGWALPGGFVDPGESLETAVRREAREETGMTLKGLRQFHVYSDPRRDPRFHTVTVVFVAKGQGRPRAGDDAQALKIVPYAELLKGRYAFDHRKMIRDYLRMRKSKERR